VPTVSLPVCVKTGLSTGSSDIIVRRVVERPLFLMGSEEGEEMKSAIWKRIKLNPFSMGVIVTGLAYQSLYFMGFLGLTPAGIWLFLGCFAVAIFIDRRRK